MNFARLRSALRPGLKAWAAALCLAAAPSLVLAQPGTPARLTLSVSFRGVLAVTDLAASSGPAGGQITLRWTAPGYSGASLPLSYDIRVSTVANFDDPAAFAAAQPLSAFSPAAVPSPAAAGTPESLVVTKLRAGVVYYFGVAAHDSGSPQASGGWFRVPARGVNVDNFAAPFPVHPPQAPYGVSLSTGVNSATLSWLPVVRFADGIGFADPNAPAPAELSGYNVYRATSPILGTWTQLASLSTATVSYTDNASAPQDYYYVEAVNSSTDSARSLVRSAATQDLYVVAPDDQSFLYIPAALAGPFTGAGNTPASVYAISSSSQPENLGGLNGRIVKSVAFTPFQGGTTEDDRLALGGMGLISLHYEFSGSSVTVSGERAGGVAPLPQNMSVYWYNGTRWLQLYGTLDSIAQTVTVQSKYFGEYQLRTVERTGSFFFDPAGLSNRFITPNGDHKNDEVVFTYDNPKDSAVNISIYDMRGRLVVGSLPPGPVQNSQEWDAKANGRVVPGGVYIYQIKAEGQVFTGTIVVIR